MTGEMHSILLACLHAPADRAPRLALSDWLEENRHWDPLRLAALRGDGVWQIEYPTGDARWDFSITAAIQRAFPGDDLTVLVYSPAMITYTLRFGRVPSGGPACAMCDGATIGLALVTDRKPPGAKVWRCGPCRGRDPGAAASTTGQIVWLAGTQPYASVSTVTSLMGTVVVNTTGQVT